MKKELIIARGPMLVRFQEGGDAPLDIDCMYFEKCREELDKSSTMQEQNQCTMTCKNCPLKGKRRLPKKMDKGDIMKAVDPTGVPYFLDTAAIKRHKQ